MGHPDVDFNPLLSLPPPEKEMKKNTMSRLERVDPT